MRYSERVLGKELGDGDELGGSGIGGATMGMVGSGLMVVACLVMNS